MAIRVCLSRSPGWRTSPVVDSATCPPTWMVSPQRTPSDALTGTLKCQESAGQTRCCFMGSPLAAARLAHAKRLNHRTTSVFILRHLCLSVAPSEVLAVTPAKAGVHVPDAGVYGPRLSPG